jgi:hypothetical protein
VSRYFWNLQTCLKHWYFKVTDDVTGMACGLLGLCGRYEENLLAHVWIERTPLLREQNRMLLVLQYDSHATAYHFVGQW